MSVWVIESLENGVWHATGVCGKQVDMKEVANEMKELYKVGDYRITEYEPKDENREN